MEEFGIEWDKIPNEHEAMTELEGLVKAEDPKLDNLLKGNILPLLRGFYEHIEAALKIHIEFLAEIREKM